ncbi:MAG TPA: cyclic pyranopterin monophosphate synthase MoaC [Actinomycetota bacterium]|nr:cyclic pyranopterin monophosphate synthase MoaC [Actinomycetota bacterium]
MSRHPESEARMVDITQKEPSAREAVAGCTVVMRAETLQLVMSGAVPKGDALAVARVAGIMGAKATSSLIPLCHPIALGSVEVKFAASEQGLDITAIARTVERTGVEMEALTAAAVAALTIYDMVKGTERGVQITGLRLLRKSGGKSGDYEAPDGR